MSTYLDEIVARHRQAAARDGRDLSELATSAASVPPPRPFVEALVAGRASRSSCSSPTIAVIAEVKRRSPSKGDLAPHLDPGVLAGEYAAAGAACLSVLTDADYFGGNSADLMAARAACTLPALRKDFTVAEADLYDARLMGADAVLLIVAALSDGELSRFVEIAGTLGLATLVEVHDEEELRRALGAGATLVGVNQRDLRTFIVDGARAERVRAAMPDGVVSVAESGIGSPDDLRRLAESGFDAALIGEALVVSGAPGAALRRLLDGVRRSLPDGPRAPLPDGVHRSLPDGPRPPLPGGSSAPLLDGPCASLPGGSLAPLPEHVGGGAVPAVAR